MICQWEESRSDTNKRRSLIMMKSQNELKDASTFAFGDAWPINFLLDNSIFDSDISKPSDTTNRTRSLRWIPMDTEDNFNRLVQEGFPNKFNIDSFRYETNNHGFRCDNFDNLDLTKKSIIYLGCSHTFGIGSPEEDIWCSILHKSLQEYHNTEFNFINLGIGGGNIDDYLRFMPYIKKFNPYMVISSTPPINRMILPTADGIRYMGLWQEKKQDTKAFFHLLANNEKYFTWKIDVIIDAMKSITDAMDIEFFDASIHNTFFDVEEIKIQLGTKAHNRDGCHFSREIHEMFATSYFKKITEK